ncbi:DUF6626 family protein [Terasakiella pusilla]|uniref:DUF6626 family protein n=1 Tax=Terasakiella pusilla TaxID=64973 RepID=UPI003AA86CC7
MTLSKEIYDLLREMETVRNTREYSNMYGRSDGYIRTCWTRNNEPTLTAYQNLQESLEAVMLDTEDFIAKHDIDDDRPYKGGIDAILQILDTITEKVRNHGNKL